MSDEIHVALRKQATMLGEIKGVLGEMREDVRGLEPRVRELETSRARHRGALWMLTAVFGGLIGLVAKVIGHGS